MFPSLTRCLMTSTSSLRCGKSSRGKKYTSTISMYWDYHRSRGKDICSHSCVSTLYSCQISGLEQFVFSKLLHNCAKRDLVSLRIVTWEYTACTTLCGDIYIPPFAYSVRVASSIVCVCFLPMEAEINYFQSEILPALFRIIALLQCFSPSSSYTDAPMVIRFI